MLNREIDFGFGCGAMRACRACRACVRACVRSCVRVRKGRWFPGLRMIFINLWGAGRPPPSRARRVPKTQKNEVSDFRFDWISVLLSQ